MVQNVNILKNQSVFLDILNREIGYIFVLIGFVLLKNINFVLKLVLFRNS